MNKSNQSYSIENWRNGLTSFEVELLEKYKINDKNSYLNAIEKDKGNNSKFTDEFILEIGVRLGVDIVIDFK